MGEPVKVIYFAPRPEGRSRADFRDRWRRHGALGMSLPLWRHMLRYEHRDARSAAEVGVELPALAATAEDEYGGVGQIWIRDDEALATIWADPDVRRMEVDEEETFGRQLGALQLPTREQVVFDRAPTAFSFMAVIHRADGVDREAFSAGWEASGAQLAAADMSAHLSRYVQNRVLPESDAADGVVELGFTSPEAAAAFFGDPGLAEWLIPKEAEFIDHGRMVSLLTTETVLFDG